VSSETLFDRALYNAACKKGIISKDKIPNIDWDGENDLIVVTAFMLEDKGTYHSLDHLFKKAQDENRLPGIIARVVLHFMNRHLNKIREG